MSTLGVRLGIAIGMATTVASLFPILQLLMGDCLFEQGCGKHENLQFLAVALASCLVGFVTGWAAAHLVTIMARRGRQD